MLKYNDEQLSATLFWQVHVQELHTVVLLLCCVFAIMQKILLMPLKAAAFNIEVYHNILLCGTLV